MKLRQSVFAILFLSSLVANGQIFTWHNKNFSDSATIDSTIHKRVEHEYFTKDNANILKGSPTIIEEAAIKKNDRRTVLGDLNANGSITRGVRFGNSQGLSAQSVMNLEISGKLSPDVSLLASISDHNLPIQADGYTQTLDEFDKIYIQLNIRDRTFLTAGHLELSDQHFFSRYQRRSMGLSLRTTLGYDKKTILDLSAGVSRGEFHRLRFQGVEGNQGPYRLTGRNGESLITILSGSEQVYIDGLLMKRGENQDYIINYNTGELTFTSYRPIYSQNFITISYNYASRNYARMLFTGGISHQGSRLKTGLHWFLENDNKTAPLALDLSDEDQKILAAAGNNPELMLAPSGVLSTFDVNKILYRKVYGNGSFHYEYSTDSQEALYQVQFTYAGSGMGDYRLEKSANNGRIFTYVGLNGGDYTATRRLPAPEKSQVLAANAEYLIRGGRVGTDLAISNYDRNGFSTRGNGENTGYAARIFSNKIWHIGRWTSEGNLEYQHIDSRFHILDRINEVEFSRDFNLAKEFRQITQDRLIFGLNNTWKDQGFVNYRFNFLNEKQQYRGTKSDLNFSLLRGKLRSGGALSYLSTKSPEIRTQFARGRILNEFLTARNSFGIGAAMEQNVKQLADNRMEATSFSWKELFIQTKANDSVRTNFSAKIYFRDNDSVRDSRLQNVNQVAGLVAESHIINTTTAQLSALAHYRRFFYQDKSFAGKNQDFIIGNINYSQQLFKSGMRLKAFYEIGNGQEAQREFQYLKVRDGQGLYKWTDYNSDGLQQLDEFEVAEYSDMAQFIRIYSNTLSYLPSNKNKLQLAVFLNPGTVFNSDNQFLKRWNFNMSLQSQNSFYKRNRILAWNPFSKEDDQILKNQNLLISAQFNPTEHSGWNGNYRYTATDNLINSNFSQENSRRTSHLLTVGYWFNKYLRADWENTGSDISNTSQLFSSRNYTYHVLESRPKITYKIADGLQAEAAAALRYKNRSDGPENINSAELTAAGQWDHKTTSLRGTFTFINNDFKGNSYSVVGNQMLDGLKPGRNLVWNFYLQQALNAFIMLNVNYDGRNSGDRTIHIGSVQIKATF